MLGTKSPLLQFCKYTGTPIPSPQSPIYLRSIGIGGTPPYPYPSGTLLSVGIWRSVGGGIGVWGIYVLGSKVLFLGWGYLLRPGQKRVRFFHFCVVRGQGLEPRTSAVKGGVLPTELTPSRCFTGNIYTLAC